MYIKIVWCIRFSYICRAKSSIIKGRRKPENMERKTRGNPKRMKSSSGTLCLPRFKGNNKNKRLSPMTLLERFREAVLRLIMLSALTKASSSHQHSTSSSAATPRRYYRPAESQYHSEAVADCIEFIKKKASSREDNRDSSASSSSTMDGTTSEVVMPVPVM